MNFGKPVTIQGHEKALFIYSKKPNCKAAMVTTEGWVKETIAGAYQYLLGEEQLGISVRSHDTRVWWPPGLG